MKQILLNIKMTFKLYIIDPILRWYHYYIKHAFIEDNQRNDELIEYLYKILHNPNYQPQTPVEHYAEQQYIISCYNQLKKNNDDLIFDSSTRRYIAARGVLKIREYYIL